MRHRRGAYAVEYTTAFQPIQISSKMCSTYRISSGSSIRGFLIRVNRGSDDIANSRTQALRYILHVTCTVATGQEVTHFI